jgi:hypothetical protein
MIKIDVNKLQKEWNHLVEVSPIKIYQEISKQDMFDKLVLHIKNLGFKDSFNSNIKYGDYIYINKHGYGVNSSSYWFDNEAEGYTATLDFLETKSGKL